MFHYMHLAGKMKSFIVKHFPSRSKQSLQCVDSHKKWHPNLRTPKRSKKTWPWKNNAHATCSSHSCEFCFVSSCHPFAPKKTANRLISRNLSTGHLWIHKISPKNCFTGWNQIFIEPIPNPHEKTHKCLYRRHEFVFFDTRIRNAYMKVKLKH